MASRLRKSNVRKIGRHSPVQKGQGKLPQGIKKERARRPVRKIARLKQIQYLQDQTIPQDRSTEREHPFPSPAGNIPSEKNSQPPLLQAQNRKRKRLQETEDPHCYISARPLQKQLRRSFTSPALEDTSTQDATSISKRNISPIGYWAENRKWPKEYFERESNMSHLLARKKSSPSLRRKQSESGSLTVSSTTPSSTTPSDQKPREVKSAPYQDSRYETLLATQGSYMSKSKCGVTDQSKNISRTLLEKEQSVPKDSLFRDDLFEETCEAIRNRNEARVIRDISLLIVPSAQTLAIYGMTHLKILIESVNEGWNNSIPVTKIRPQPDYSLGFKREAFTEDQLQKLQPFVGELTDTSFFMATFYMYLPFLTCEVKCGAAALDIADRQNAHSMTLAVRAVIELFRLVKREQELHREILAFSISHDHRTVRIYGHYALIDGNKTTFYRHPIHTFDFTALDGKEKWTAYKFTRNVYDIWMPTHFKRICSAIDQIPPGVDFDVSQSELQFSQLSSAESGLVLEDDDSQPSQLSYIGSADVTPTTSFTEQTQVSKKPRKKR